MLFKILKIFPKTQNVSKGNEKYTPVSRKREGHKRAVIISFCILFLLQEAPRGLDSVLQARTIL